MKKKRLFFQSIFSRFSLAVLAIFFASVLLLVGVNGLAIKYYYADLRKEELSYISFSAIEAIENQYVRFKWRNPDGAFWEEDGWMLWEELPELTDDTASFVIVTDEHGNYRYVDPSVSWSYLPIGEQYLPYQTPDAVIDDHGKLGILKEDHYYYAANAFVEDEYIGTVFVLLPVSSVTQPVNAIVSLITVGSVGVMALMLLIAYFVSRRITLPLAKMSTAAKAFAEGDFSVRVPIAGRDEIGEFAKVFNEMAESLETIEKTRNDFIANVSHDLRSPMTSINGFIEGMLNGVIPPEQHEHYLGVVLKETKRLSRLVTTLLDISRIQAGDRQFVMTNFDICEIARRILFSFEKRIEEKKLDVHFALDDERMYVTADLDAIYQVLYNLSDNAVKFSREGGKLVLSVTEREGKILVSVYNEGEGLMPEDLKLVFERFYKADKSRGIDKSGTGLGLYIAKKIMEAHKETIFVESEYQNFCRFSFTLAKGENTGRFHHIK